MSKELSDKELFEKCGTDKIITKEDLGLDKKRKWWECFRNK